MRMENSTEQKKKLERQDSSHSRELPLSRQNQYMSYQRQQYYPQNHIMKEIKRTQPEQDQNHHGRKIIKNQGTQGPNYHLKDVQQLSGIQNDFSFNEQDFSNNQPLQTVRFSQSNFTTIIQDVPMTRSITTTPQIIKPYLGSETYRVYTGIKKNPQQQVTKSSYQTKKQKFQAQNIFMAEELEQEKQPKEQVDLQEYFFDENKEALRIQIPQQELSFEDGYKFENQHENQSDNQQGHYRQSQYDIEPEYGIEPEQDQMFEGSKQERMLYNIIRESRCRKGYKSEKFSENEDDGHINSAKLRRNEKKHRRVPALDKQNSSPNILFKRDRVLIERTDLVSKLYSGSSNKQLTETIRTSDKGYLDKTIKQIKQTGNIRYISPKGDFIFYKQNKNKSQGSLFDQSMQLLYGRRSPQDQIEQHTQSHNQSQLTGINQQKQQFKKLLFESQLSDTSFISIQNSRHQINPNLFKNSSKILNESKVIQFPKTKFISQEQLILKHSGNPFNYTEVIQKQQQVPQIQRSKKSQSIRKSVSKYKDPNEKEEQYKEPIYNKILYSTQVQVGFKQEFRNVCPSTGLKLKRNEKHSDTYLSRYNDTCFDRADKRKQYQQQMKHREGTAIDRQSYVRTFNQKMKTQDTIKILKKLSDYSRGKVEWIDLQDIQNSLMNEDMHPKLMKALRHTFDDAFTGIQNLMAPIQKNYQGISQTIQQNSNKIQQLQRIIKKNKIQMKKLTKDLSQKQKIIVSLVQVNQELKGKIAHFIRNELQSSQQSLEKQMVQQRLALFKKSFQDFFSSKENILKLKAKDFPKFKQAFQSCISLKIIPDSQHSNRFNKSKNQGNRNVSYQTQNQEEENKHRFNEYIESIVKKKRNAKILRLSKKSHQKQNPISIQQLDNFQNDSQRIASYNNTIKIKDLIFILGWIGHYIETGDMQSLDEFFISISKQKIDMASAIELNNQFSNLLQILQHFILEQTALKQHELIHQKEKESIVKYFCEETKPNDYRQSLQPIDYCTILLQDSLNSHQLYQILSQTTKDFNQFVALQSEYRMTLNINYIRLVFNYCPKIKLKQKMQALKKKNEELDNIYAMWGRPKVRLCYQRDFMEFIEELQTFSFKDLSDT